MEFHSGSFLWNAAVVTCVVIIGKIYWWVFDSLGARQERRDRAAKDANVRRNIVPKEPTKR